MNAFVINTLAEYQTRFWLRVGQALQAAGYSCSFVSFDDRSTEMLRDAGFAVSSANEAVAPDTPAGRRALFEDVGINRLAFWTAHERFAFGRADDAEMERKLARAILATRAALATVEAGTPVLVQEVGGFLSVIGAFFAARAEGVTNWFIEPSFFRGRLLFTRDTFSAPRLSATVSAAVSAADDDAFENYIDATLASGAIVIPQKDRHHYSSARKKVFNVRNARRLLEKLVDKHLLGKRQEFGFIGSHVATHLKMLLNSRKLRGRYTDAATFDRFVYYPLHVPGDMALTLRSPEYLDQLALIDYLVRHLPDGTALAVKEHPAMIGMIDADRLLGLLDRYPNLALIDPSTNNYDVLRRAAAVVTVNSKSGAEAGLLGKRVIVLGDAFYRDAPFAKPLTMMTELGAALEAALDGSDKAPPTDDIRSYFANLWPASYPGELYDTDSENVARFTDSLLEALADSRPL